MLYREGMSGLILFAAVFAVIIFVVAVKYVETLVFGMPTGEFVVFSMIMAIMIGMSVMYSRRIEIGRNLLILFAGTALVEWALTAFWDIAVPGLAVTLGVIFAGCVYIVIESIRRRRNKMLIGVATAVLSVIFLFSVNFRLRPSAAPSADAHQSRPRS